MRVIAGNYTHNFETWRKKSWTGRWKRIERKLLLLPCLSRGFAMRKQLKGPSHLTLSEKREIVDKTKSMKYWKRISSTLDAKPNNRYHNTGLCPRLWPPEFLLYNILRISLKKKKKIQFLIQTKQTVLQVDNLGVSFLRAVMEITISVINWCRLKFNKVMEKHLKLIPKVVKVWILLIFC